MKGHRHSGGASADGTVLATSVCKEQSLSVRGTVKEKLQTFILKSLCVCGAGVF